MDKLTMSNMARGALSEQFETELEKVLENIMDPNTEAKKPRKITINMEFKPNEQRNMAQIKCQAKSVVVPANTVETAIIIGKNNDGGIEAAELGQEVYGQMEIKEDGEIQETGNVVNYVRKQGGTSMIKEAMAYLLDLGKTEILEIHGQKYSTKNIQHVKHPSPAALSITTLTGLVDYIKSGIDLNAKINYPSEGDCDVAAADELLVQVMSPTKVKLYSPLLNDESRDCYIEATALTPNILFNSFADTENFNIMLQSGFIQNEHSTAVLKVVGNIKESIVRGVSDDGISQEVTAKAGIVKVANVPVPNPVILKPFRTFIEVEQPESKFILRMQDGPRAALFEADGGAWKNEAMKSIKEYLTKELTGYSVEVIS